jgi:hypothetical protein
LGEQAVTTLIAASAIRVVAITEMTDLGCLGDE